GFLIGAGTEVQTATLTDSEDTFNTVDQIVYWNDTDKSFSDKLTVGYYKVGQLKTVKDSGVIVFTKFEKAEIVATDVATLQAVVVANAALGGRFFKKTAKLTSAAAKTPVHLLTDAEVGSGKKAYVSKIYFSVDGETDWATTATVTLQDTATSPVVGATVAVAGLTANAMIDEGNTNVTLAAPIADGAGFTAAKGLDIVGNANGTGSDLIVTVFGCIM
ncbi:MAG TPA: hypothetical protein PLN48_14900, partial [Lachnospiraceae bacterium]|nr:hypothetical protein [Lachnospiraceae bacterium]